MIVQELKMTYQYACDDATHHYFDSDVGFTGVDGPMADDVRFYVSALAGCGAVLDVCSGSGRLALPIAREAKVWALDRCDYLVSRLAHHASTAPRDVRERIKVFNQDALLPVPSLEGSCDAAIVAFNSLLYFDSQQRQLALLRATGALLEPGGVLILDVLPLSALGPGVMGRWLAPSEDEHGAPYMRYAASGPIGADQRQLLYGYYDVVAADATVRRAPYAHYWRPVSLGELELMLPAAGFSIEAVYGGFGREPFTYSSPKIVLIARKAQRAA